ncbi:hypothetical protein [uncultured Hymenobacter sp.]|uniref:hypothetical protein n=1 Tax=uncultured Hymenobacter sp. TaxID=170016 RepID=UPI0035CB21D7
MTFSLSLPLLPHVLCAISLVTLSTACVNIHENARASLESIPETKLELRHFSVLAEGTTQRLEWETNEELACAYFVVERQVGQAAFKEIAQVLGDPMAVTPRHHAFVDATPAAGSVHYRLLQVDLDGLVHTGPTLETKLDSPYFAIR